MSAPVTPATGTGAPHGSISSTTVPSTASTGSDVSGGYRFSGFTVPHILSWKDPHATGILLAEAVGLWIVFSSTLTLRLFLRLAAWSIGLLSGVEYITRQINGSRSGAVSNFRPSRFLPVSENTINTISTSVASTIRRSLNGVEHVVDARDPVTGLRVAGLAWVFFVLLGIFSLRTLALVAIVLTFALPPLYLQFKPQVDSHLSHVGTHLHTQANKVHSAAYAKAGPQIDFAKKLLGNRSRGGFPSQPAGTAPTSRGLDASTGVSSGVSNPYATGVPTGAGAGTAGAGAHSASIPVANLPKTSAGSMPGPAVGTLDPAAGVPLTQKTNADVFQTFDSVPTLAGNVKLDKETVDKFTSDANNLRSSIAQDKQGL